MTSRSRSTRPSRVLADWWAETLGWVVEPSDETFIRKMIAEGYARSRPRILFQLVPDARPPSQARRPLRIARLAA